MRAQADSVLNMTAGSTLDVSGGGPSFSLMMSGVSDVDVTTVPLPTTRGVSHKTSQILQSLNLNTSIGQHSKSTMLAESPSKSFRGNDQKFSENGMNVSKNSAHQAGWYQRGYWKTKYQKF
jgi:hypothetical protein